MALPFQDSFLDAVSEMEQSPEVAILQQCSGTFLAGAGYLSRLGSNGESLSTQLSRYFESGIAFFTQIVNFSISWTVSNVWPLDLSSVLTHCPGRERKFSSICSPQAMYTSRL